jgi:hypothetical protein
MLKIYIKTRDDRERKRIIKYSFGDTVYNRSDLDQIPLIVRAVYITDESVIYQCRCGAEITEYLEMELSDKRDEDLVLKYREGGDDIDV